MTLIRCEICGKYGSHDLFCPRRRRFPTAKRYGSVIISEVADPQ